MIPPDPIERFRGVYALVEKIDRSILPEPSAMALGTVAEHGGPSVRIVLLKGFDERVAKYEKEFEGKAVPRPEYWSGFRVWPERIEFWKGKPNRLHERHLYTRDGDGWLIETLYP
ncbi:MAG TPA: pyridoxine 5'-phosphate oxidase C-terminal domain-containing protein [Gemmatimonadaceae bacterium]|nr:pyridoxine 5'-phosphate oxidase C-terminal domain-containing protein [Gemmatimonadaceae bacterium]